MSMIKLKPRGPDCQSWLSTRLHLESTKTQAMEHSCERFPWSNYLKLEGLPWTPVALTRGGRNKRTKGETAVRLPSPSLASSTSLLPRHSFTDVRSYFFRIPVSPEDWQLQEVLRNPEPGRYCWDIQHHGLSNCWILCLSGVRQSLLGYPDLIA